MAHENNLNILDQLHRFEIKQKKAIRVDKKLNKQTEAYSNYAENITIYKKIHNITSCIVLDYIANFVCFGNTIYFIHNWSIDSSNYIEFFKYLGLYYDEDLSKKIIISLRTLLKLTSTNKSYANTLMFFKYTLNISFPIIFDYPAENFCIFNSSLCAYKRNYNSIISCELITNDSFIEALSNLDYAFKRNLFTSLKKELKFHSNSIVNTNLIYINPLYEINYLNRDFSFKITYNIQNDKFDMISNYSCKFFEKRCQLYNVYKETELVPQNAITVIEDISTKNVYNIDLLSELAAYILLNKCPNDGILLINCNKQAKDNIIGFLQLFSENNLFFLKIKDLRHKNTIDKLINLDLNGSNGIVISSIKGYEKLENERILKKLINGSSISVNSISGKNYYKNKMPIIYFATTDKEFLSVKNNFKCKVFNFKNSNNAVNFDVLEGIDHDWIKIIFPLLGVRNLALRKSPSSKNIQATSNDNLKYNDIKYFIKEFCINKKDSICYAIDFHNAYLDYYKSTFDSECLSYIMFNKQVKKMAKYEYYRPHISRSEPNRYAFKGITVNNEKLNDYCKSQATQKEYSSIGEYLKKINYLNPGFNNKDYLDRLIVRISKNN